MGMDHDRESGHDALAAAHEVRALLLSTEDIEEFVHQVATRPLTCPRRPQFCREHHG